MLVIFHQTRLGTHRVGVHFGQQPPVLADDVARAIGSLCNIAQVWPGGIPEVGRLRKL